MVQRPSREGGGTMRFKHNPEYFALVVVLAVLLFFVIAGSQTDATPYPAVGTLYEDAAIPLIVDFNGDGSVDFEDFAKLAQYWLQDESSVDVAPPPGDLMVDMQDVVVLTEYWLKEGVPVGPDGGTVSDPGGASVVIPPGALPEETWISVKTHYDTSTLESPIGNPWVPFVGGVSLGPAGQVFQEPVTITIPLTGELTPGSELPLCVYREDLGVLEETDFLAVVNPDGLSASAEVTHFSIFIVQQSQLENAGLFGAFLPEDTYTSMFNRVIARFNDIFPFGDKRIVYFPLYPDSYNCYTPVAIEFNLYHEDEPGVANPLYHKTGNEGNAEIFLNYIRIIDITVKAGGVEKQLIGDFFVNVWLQSVPPTLSLEVDKSTLNVGEQTAIRGCLICGIDGMEDQQIDFGVYGVGEIWPTQAATSSDGKAEITFRALPPGCTDGTATVTAAHEWSSPAGDVTLMLGAETGIDVPFPVESLAGVWSVTEIADETDCGEGINTYTYTLDITQSGSRITGTLPFFGRVTGRISGCTVTGFGIERLDDFGDTYGEGELTISQDGNTMTGHADWVWVAIDPDPGEIDTCSGSSTFTLTRQVCDVPPSLAGVWSVTEIANEAGCGEGVNIYTDTGIISEPGWDDGSWIIGEFSSWYFYGRRRGCTITGFGGQSEDHGFTYGEGELTISQDGNTMDGHADWQWNRIDPYTGQWVICYGSSSFAFRR